VKRVTKAKISKRREPRYRSIDRASEVRLGYRIEATNQDKAVVPLWWSRLSAGRKTIAIAIAITITTAPNLG
jgi:hypothetical protein